MGTEMAKTQVETETKNVKIQTSVQMWRDFESWWRSLGKTSIAEGFRTAMEKVTRSGRPDQA